MTFLNFILVAVLSICFAGSAYVGGLLLFFGALCRDAYIKMFGVIAMVAAVLFLLGIYAAVPYKLVAVPA